MKFRSSRPALLESLEARTLLSATVTSTSITNVTKLVGSQQTPTVAINPTNPNDQFIIASDNAVGVAASTSTDGGATWTTQTRFTGADGFPQAMEDPTAAYDQFGNLFVAYQRTDNNTTEVLYSYDNGQTFHVLTNLKGIQYQTVLATGDGTLWLAADQARQTGNPPSIADSAVVTYATTVTGLGRIGKLNRVAEISTVDSNIESIVVGPAGQVAVAYQFATPVGPSAVYIATDPKGLGGKFNAAETQVQSEIGNQDLIPAQAVAGISAGASLAFDDSGDAFTGRLYMVYTDASSPDSADTNIYLVYSDNDGATWSAPSRVNDDVTSNSQFMPQVAVDPISGAVAATWYDCRNDNGTVGAGGTNTTPNDDVQVYGAIGTGVAGGVDFSPNVIVQGAYSNANDIFLPSGDFNTDQFGLHNSMAFYDSKLTAAWADDSNSTGDNSDGTLDQTEIYAAVMPVVVTPAATATLTGVFGGRNGAYHYTAANGSKMTFQVSAGHGYVLTDSGGNLYLRVSGTTLSSVLNLSGSAGSAAPQTYVNGSLAAVVAPSLDVTTSFTISGQVKRVSLGNISGGVFSASGAIGTMTVKSLTNAKVLSGALPGPTLIFGGAGDSFASGSIKSLVVHGAITTSFVGAGVNPVDGVFGNGNDTIIGGAASAIGMLRAGSADNASKFEAGAFGKVLLPSAVDPTSDPRFLVG